MKLRTMAVGALVVGALTVFPFLGCTQEQPAAEEENDGSFSHAQMLDENGFYKNIKAKDHVEMFDYDNLSIPSDSHEVSDEAVQAQVDAMVKEFATATQVTDRAIADGDTVNIDYVGSVDGVPFEGGDTKGAGTEVVIGQTSYVDDFIEQLIGHMPGETFDVEVTFPDGYQNPELSNKDAVFSTTINFISEPTEVELNDEFVARNLESTRGWKTVDEMKQGLREELEKQAVQTYVQNYLLEDVTVNDIPEEIKTYQGESLIDNAEQYAQSMGASIDDLLSSQGVSSVEELVEQSSEDIERVSRLTLAVQAVAEEAGLTVSDEEVTTYFKDTMGTEDITPYEERYGMPYIKQTVLGQKVIDYIAENANLE